MLSSWSVRISLLAIAALVLGPLLAHLGVIAPMQGFLLFGLSALVGLVGIVAGIISVLRGRAKPGTLAIGLGLLAMLLVLLPAFMAGKLPRLNDVSTDLEDPPALTRAPPAGRGLEYPPAFVPLMRESYADLKPLQLAEPPEAVLARVQTLAREQPGWTLVGCDAQACEGYSESRLFRFRDDFAIRVRAGEGGGSRVDMRSRSRDGKGDFGVNAARVRHFFAQLSGKPAAASAGR